MNRRSSKLSRLAVAASLFTLFGCSTPSREAKEAEAFAAYAVPAVPDGARRTFVDFGGKLALVGYELSPEGTAGPGTTIHAKLYWKRVGKLGAGWSLFTHLVDDQGRQLRNFDGEGDFRKALAGKMPTGLAGLELGAVYVDEQSLGLPGANELTPKVSLLVGVWRDDMRLPVVSGPTDGKQAAILANYDTGVERPSAVAQGPQGTRP
jgi:hypothetical protein